MLARAWSMPAAERAEDQDAVVRRGGAPPRIASSVSDSSLSCGDRSSGTPAASSAASASSPIESPSPTHRSIATPRAAAWRAPPSAAMTISTPSSQPGQARSRSERGGDVAVGEDESDHGRDATRARPADAAVRPPVPRPMLDSGRARRPHSSRDPARPRCRRPQGRDARGRPVRRVDPYRRRSGRGARRGARADREVAGLRHPGRVRWRAGPVPRRRPQPRRPRAARGGHQRPGHPPRDGARGTRPDRLLDRWHPADRHGPASSG